METEGGNYLNVTLKNKILSQETILQFLEKNNYTNKNNQEKLREKLELHLKLNIQKEIIG